MYNYFVPILSFLGGILVCACIGVMGSEYITAKYVCRALDSTHKDSLESMLKRSMVSLIILVAVIVLSVFAIRNVYTAPSVP